MMSDPNANILLIDDDPYIHDAVKMVLEPQGYHVSGCLTGPAGLAAMRQRRPDLVLLDIMLATASEGFHLAYEMKRDPALATVPIIVLSAIGQAMGMDYATEVGTEYLPVDRFLEKPFDARTLLEAVEQVLRRKGVPA